MAHKTLVNSTAYEISGGKTLVEGTSYSVKNGKVLIGGSAYDISFLLPPAALNLWNGTESSVTVSCSKAVHKENKKTKLCSREGTGISACSFPACRDGYKCLYVFVKWHF